MKVLVAMSGGVDSSVAAALLAQEGHEVVGATMKLWSGPSDSGCCSVGDTEDARRVAQQLGITHHVFNFSADFDRQVVEPYVADHAAGRTPNPCVSCNRHIKFDRFLIRARQLGFDAMATGHHARVERRPDGHCVLRRGADPAKDQSYVLHMLDQAQLRRTLLPVGVLTKSAVRELATRLGLRTAAKPDSQDVCFIPSAGGREAFLGDRIPLRPGRVLDGTGRQVGTVPAVELVTVGQRRHLGAIPGAERRYAVAVDLGSATVTLGPEAGLMVDRLHVADAGWVDGEPPAGTAVDVQTSAHGRPVPARWQGEGTLALDTPVRRVAAGQAVAVYDGDRLLGGGTAQDG